MSEKLVIPKILAARFRGGYSKLELAPSESGNPLTPLQKGKN